MPTTPRYSSGWHSVADRLIADGYGPKDIQTELADAGHTVAYKTVQKYRHRQLQASQVTAIEVDDTADEVDAQLAEARRLIDKARAEGMNPKSVKIESGGGSEWDAQVKGGGIAQLESTRKAKSTIVVAAGGSATVASQLERAPHVTVKMPKPPRRHGKRPAGWKTISIMLDGQIGYWLDRHGVWHTTHDEAAMNVSIQIAQRFAELHDGLDVLVDVGDLFDFPTLSRYLSAPATVRPEALNMSTARGAREFASYRAIVGPFGRVVAIEGNHEARMQKNLVAKVPELVGVTGPDGLPVLSLRHLTGSDDYGVEWVGPYPEAELLLAPNFRILHGTVAKSKAGATCDTYLNEEVSTVAGHTTRAGQVFRRVPRGDKVETHVAVVGGGRMKVDGSVPDGGGINEWGEPGRAKQKPWHQGVVVGFYDPEGVRTPQLEYVSIYDGWAMWRGMEFHATVDSDGNPLDS